MTLLHPWTLLLLFALLWLFRDLFRLKHGRTVHHSLYLDADPKRQKRQTLYLFASLLLAILALSRPVLVDEVTKQKFNANEYIIALDASFSMQADDVLPTRYTAAKEAIRTLLMNSPHDRFSLYVFTTNPLLICPPTTDSAIAINALDAISPEYILTKGTSLRALLERIGKVPMAHKELIIFTDGGEERDLDTLLGVAKKRAITIHIVAVGSAKGSVLKKAHSHLHDENGHLVISMINPILKGVVKYSGGSYRTLQKKPQEVGEELAAALSDTQVQKHEQETEVISYLELYYYPLLLSLLLLLAAVTKITTRLPFLALLLILYSAPKSDASLLDFYYISAAKDAYEQQQYTRSADYYKKVTPSQGVYLNIAHSLYKAKHYKEAMKYYSRIRSHDKQLKQTLFYNMGNCAVRLKRYERAKDYYQKALALGPDDDAYENLMLLYRLGLKSDVDVADMMPHPDAKEQKNSSKKSEQQQGDENENKSEGGSGSQRSSLSTQGGGDGDDKKRRQQRPSSTKASQQQYRLGYRAYELINEGYSDEQHPW